MKAITLDVYRKFEQCAATQGRPIADLMHEVRAAYPIPPKALLHALKPTSVGRVFIALGADRDILEEVVEASEGPHGA